MEKVKIASAVVRTFGDNKEILNITLADGRVGSSYDITLKDKIGQEIELIVKEGKEYNGVMQYYFNLPKENKPGNFPKKDYTFEKRRVALECATQLHKGNQNIGLSDEVLKDAEKFNQWLNK